MSIEAMRLLTRLQNSSGTLLASHHGVDFSPIGISLDGFGEFPSAIAMNIKNRDLFILMLILLAACPAVLGVILIATGTIHLDIASKIHAAVPDKKTVATTIAARADSVALANSKTLLAIQNERSAIEQEKQALSQEQQGMAVFRNDLDSRKQQLDSVRQSIGSLVQKVDSVAVKKMARLSKVYASMRAPEAAQIIGTLPEKTAATILDGINDDRQKAKIIAALPPEKAVSLTQYLCGPTATSPKGPGDLAGVKN